MVPDKNEKLVGKLNALIGKLGEWCVLTFLSLTSQIGSHPVHCCKLERWISHLLRSIFLFKTEWSKAQVICYQQIS